LFLLPYVWKGSNFDGGMSNDLWIRKNMEGSGHWLIWVSISECARTDRHSNLGPPECWPLDCYVLYVRHSLCPVIQADHDIIKLQLSLSHSSSSCLNCHVRKTGSVHMEAIAVSYKLHLLLPFTKNLKHKQIL
jgi:hypothetical protein